MSLNNRDIKALNKQWSAGDSTEWKRSYAIMMWGLFWEWKMDLILYKQLMQFP